MRLLCQDRLALSDPGTIKDLIGDLAACRKPLLADAAEILPNSTVWIREIKEQYFTVETEYLPNDLLAVPLSSWRIMIVLEGASLCLTTVSLARLDSAVFGLAYPEEIVSGLGRRYYRVSALDSEPFQVSLIQPNQTAKVEVTDASFSEMEAKIVNGSDSRLAADSKVILAGRHHGVLFKEPAVVTWREDDKIGVALSEDEGLEALDERPWSHVVRRMAYDQFMKNLRAA